MFLDFQFSQKKPLKNMPIRGSEGDLLAAGESLGMP